MPLPSAKTPQFLFVGSTGSTVFLSGAAAVARWVCIGSIAMPAELKPAPLRRCIHMRWNIAVFSALAWLKASVGIEA